MLTTKNYRLNTLALLILFLLSLTEGAYAKNVFAEQANPAKKELRFSVVDRNTFKLETPDGQGTKPSRVTGYTYSNGVQAFFDIDISDDWVNNEVVVDIDNGGCMQYMDPLIGIDSEYRLTLDQTALDYNYVLDGDGAGNFIGRSSLPWYCFDSTNKTYLPVVTTS
jgi:hypothetical protein